MANPSLPTFYPGQSQRELQDLTRTQRRLSEQLKANKMALQALDAGSSVRPALTQGDSGSGGATSRVVQNR